VFFVIRRSLVITALLVTGCLDLAGDCTNHVIAEATSPRGEQRAVVFQRSCGATTGFSTQVSLVRIGVALPDSGGNVFIADDDHGRAPAGPAGGPQVEVRWLASDTLEVRYDRRARVFKREPHAPGVEVRFVTDSAEVS
jgi:hypothetical protein